MHVPAGDSKGTVDVRIWLSVFDLFDVNLPAHMFTIDFFLEASWEDEQQRPALQICFGSDRDAESLMEQSCFIQACEALYTPLISAMVPERRRRG